MDERRRGVEAAKVHQFFGVKITEATAETARLEMTVEEHVLNPAGVLHGGVLYALCDSAAYVALLGQLGAEEEAVTHDIHVSVMRPVSPGSRLCFDATIDRKGKTLAFLSTRATVDNKLVATARITKSLVPSTRGGS